MGYLTHQFSKRALVAHPIQLQTALIQSMHPPVNETQQTFSLHSLPLNDPLHPCSDRGRQTIRLIWGNPARCHSFVCEGGNLAKVELRDENTLLFHLADPIPDEDREKNKELLFYVDAHDELEISVDNQSASTFYLGQTIQLKSGDIQVQLQLILIDGAGDFIGHIMEGTCPSPEWNKRITQIQRI